MAGLGLVWACGGESPTAPSTPEPTRPTTVTVSPATAELTALDATAQLTAEVRDQNARVMANVTVTWSSSDTSVATVSASGLVTATDNGTATITASAGSASGSATVTVAQAPDSVAVSPAAATITALGDTLRLAAQAFDVNGRAVAGAEFSWESSADSVATVGTSGLVTGLAEGTATITASAGPASGSSVVTVTQPVASVEVSPSTETIGLGSTLQLTAEGFDENGDVVVGAEFSWESSDAAIARVNASGLVTGVAEGATTITASAGSGQGTAEIAVMDLERAALVALYRATDGPSWINNENWLTDAPLREWYGVETDASGRVVRLDLAGRWDREAEAYVQHGLSGPIPLRLGDLTGLESLHLSVNDLSGPIPAELGKLAGLETLDLTRNNLSGPIPPKLGHLTSLERLYLHRNELTGPIPPELGHLVALERLYLYSNNLSGPIPSELGNLADLERLHIGWNDLSGPIVTELGELASLTSLSLASNRLTGPIPPELGNLGHLESLYLQHNDLSGAVPAELGMLVNLDRLDLERNNLTSSIPDSFLELDALERFRFDRNAELCAPGTIDFVTWLEGIEDTSGPYCNESDMNVLDRLYQTSGGPDWTNSSGWLGTPALEEWYGVTANSLGRVEALDLTRNGLAGELPASLGSLAEMKALRVGTNALSGRLPLSLAQLPLVELQYADTDLCIPAETSFGTWLNGISSHEGTGVECGPPSDREILVALYELADGPSWDRADNWLTDAPLNDWYGVDADDSGRVVGLDLYRNSLSGPIPLELANLASLEWLQLTRNELTGPVPPELANLTSLDGLGLADNDLVGPIPPVLGRLTRLSWLSLSDNNLSGPIPSELGGLTGMRSLFLSGNDLSGPIPPELANLSSLHGLVLSGNDLTGAIPPALGRLTSLTWLYLAGNDLTGPIPSELGNLTRMEGLYVDSNNLTGALPLELAGISTLRRLSLGNNSGLTGSVPAGLTNLRLETLLAGGTDLCAPSDPGFQAWLETVHQRRIVTCASGAGSLAYLTQAVQSRQYPVPLVAGERALLRGFVTATHPTTAGIPPVRARFYVNGTERHVTRIPAKAMSIPIEVLEASLSASANAEIPGEVVQPGLEMVIEIDPDGTLDPRSRGGEADPGDGAHGGRRARDAAPGPHGDSLPLERRSQQGSRGNGRRYGGGSRWSRTALECSYAAADW